VFRNAGVDVIDDIRYVAFLLNLLRGWRSIRVALLFIRMIATSRNGSPGNAARAFSFARSAVRHHHFFSFANWNVS
jgi:hypothetical protein